MLDLELTVIVDADGNYQIGKDVDEAQDNWDANEGRPSDGLKVYNVMLRVVGPKAVAVTATLPEHGPVTVAVT